MAAMINEAIPSARVFPVTMMTMPAIAVKMKAARSVKMCWKLPSMFIDSRLAFESCQVATRFTASATIRINLPSAGGGVISRLMPS